MRSPAIGALPSEDLNFAFGAITEAIGGSHGQTASWSQVTNTDNAGVPKAPSGLNACPPPPPRS